MFAAPQSPRTHFSTTYCVFLVLLSALVPAHHCLSLTQKAQILKPSLYDLHLFIKSNVSDLTFTYYMINIIHLDIDRELDELVLETRADYVFRPHVQLNHSIDLDVEEFQLEQYYVLRRLDGSLFFKGHYTVDLLVAGLIREESLGIEYSLHKDRKTKKVTYSILVDFRENLAKQVMVCLSDVNSPGLIRLNVTTELGFNAYFVKQPVTQT